MWKLFGLHLQTTTGNPLSKICEDIHLGGEKYDATAALHLMYYAANAPKNGVTSSNFPVVVLKAGSEIITLDDVVIYPDSLDINSAMFATYLNKEAKNFQTWDAPYDNFGTGARLESKLEPEIGLAEKSLQDGINASMGMNINEDNQVTDVVFVFLQKPKNKKVKFAPRATWVVAHISGTDLKRAPAGNAVVRNKSND
jgi:hypothetical protein